MKTAINKVDYKLFGIIIACPILVMTLILGITSSVPVNATTSIVMNDTTASWGLNVYTNNHNPFGEYASSPNSDLTGKSIDTIKIKMKKTGAVSGNIIIGIFDSNQTVKKIFGNQSASALSTFYSFYTYSLPFGQSYNITSGDIIGIKYMGVGDISNSIAVMSDQTNSFDTTNSFMAYWDNNVTKFIANADVTMALTLSTNYTVSIIPPEDILSVTTNSSRNIPALGSYTITDPNDESPIVTNNSTGNFPIGKTRILWAVHDKNGQVATGIQTVTVIQAHVPTNGNNRVIMINDDDGPLGMYRFGLPILDKYSVKATFFVICGVVGGSNSYYMNWSQIHSLSADGQDVQSHTMNQLDATKMSQAQLDYQFGQSKRCLAGNGTSNVHMVATPFATGDTNMTVIQTIERFYDMARSGHSTSWSTYCYVSGSNYCAPYNTTTGQLNPSHRYGIPAWSHDSISKSNGYDDAKTFGDFINQVNSVHINTNNTTIEIPIVLYHNVIKTNTGSSSSGISTILLDAEMKYLRDNNFKFYNFNNVIYDANTNVFHLKR